MTLFYRLGFQNLFNYVFTHVLLILCEHILRKIGSCQGDPPSLPLFPSTSTDQTSMGYRATALQINIISLM
jgi:hypothetical protein